MATEKKKKVTLCLDRETLNIVGEIPPSFRSAIVRKVIKQAKSEGRLDAMVREALGIETATPVPGPKLDAAHPALSGLDGELQGSRLDSYRSFKRLKRNRSMPIARRRPQLFFSPGWQGKTTE